jgi:hypothetical protein
MGLVRLINCANERHLYTSSCICNAIIEPEQRYLKTPLHNKQIDQADHPGCLSGERQTVVLRRNTDNNCQL